ncbi:unnamed protein product [Pocillopora meandrina]|uniref:Uncharacterized protein n=1 Tax=Pocillopora meandrina TaxID=46732 RepID=A0AAU9VJ88_9CNID|nr:unnamed protein product [Pocillopora meandrina]
MTQLIHLIETGFPKSRNELPPALREYHQFREHLYTVDGIILYKNRIHAPESTVFWPGITPAIIALTGNLQPLQPHGTLSTEFTALSSCTPSLPVPMCLRPTSFTTKGYLPCYRETATPTGPSLSEQERDPQA